MKLTEWQKLTMEQKALVATEFAMKRTGAVHVVANKVVQDGYTLPAVEALDEKKVKALLGVKEEVKEVKEVKEVVLEETKETLYEETDTKAVDGEEVTVPKAPKAKKKAVKADSE